MTSNQNFFLAFVIAAIFAGFMFTSCKDKVVDHAEIEQTSASDSDALAFAELERKDSKELKKSERRKELEARAIKEREEELAAKKIQEEKKLAKSIAARKRKEESHAKKMANEKAAKERKKKALAAKEAKDNQKEQKERARFDKVIEKQSDISKHSTKVVKNSNSNSSQVTQGKPEIVFARNFFNFEKIASGEIVDAVFKFTNIGDAPLVIENATATCGCTVPVYSFIPIEPGKSSEIKVRFDTKGKVGKQQPIITVFTNTEPSVHKLYIDGEVGPPAITDTKKDSIETKN